MPTRRPSAAGLGPRLFECARLLDGVAQAEVNREAGARVLTPALVRLLPHLSAAGIRPTELARRVEVSKQAVGQALADLETRGLVELVSDPIDGRARLVRLTAAGLAAFEHGRGVLAFYEEALAARVGQPRIDALNDLLEQVHAVLVEWTADGAPARSPAAGTRPARPVRRR
ncbi:MAG: MarR family transcriptional regulator [Vicinamibacterales bacterium]